MASEHTMRRVGRLNATPFAGKSDDEKIVACEDALGLFLDLTHRAEDLGERIDPLVCEIAKTLLGKAGQEGIKKAKDGELEREWSEQSGMIDPVLLKRIKAYRQVVGINAAYQL